MIVKHKPSILLLEVMIAFALVIMVGVFLLFPYEHILTNQKRFIENKELEHVVNLLFIDVLERMYKNEIPFAILLHEMSIQITEKDYQRIQYPHKLPFKGSFKFKKVIQKPKKEALYTLYQFELIFHFQSLEKEDDSHTINTTYYLFVVRDLAQG